MPEPRVMESTRPFEGRVVTLRVDRVRHPDGLEHLLEVVEHRETVTLVALDDAGDLVLVRQYRHPTGRALLETPAGCIDPGETPAEAANRELAEETGLRARDLRPLGGFYLAPGWATEYMHAFLALDLEPHAAEADSDERIQVERVTPADWEEMILDGRVVDCKSIAAWHLASAALGNRGAGERRVA